MAEQDLWGEIPVKKIETPKDVLIEQANIFNKKFEGKLACEVREGYEDPDPWDSIVSTAKEKEKRIVLKFYLSAPSLNKYKLLMLKVSYFATKIYPCDLENNMSELPKTEKCNTVDEFKQKLKGVLGSNDVTEAISNLFSQI